MFDNSTSTALILYTPPLTPMEFIKSEIERGLSNGSISIEQTIHHPDPFYKSRTQEINQSISYAFQKIARNTSSKWGLYNGSQAYGIAHIKEHKLMKKLILGAPEGCKDFYALDIGAGNYQWGRALAEYLNKKKDIPKDVTIHIIGIRGETNLDKTVTKLGQCKLYEFGNFQIETLMDEFQRHGLQLANKVDLVVSNWCFRHLVDPVGTFTQTYDLLRPKTGYLLIDGFFFLHENEKTLDDVSITFNERMTRLCLETQAPFLTRHYEYAYSLDHFVVNKQDDRPCHLNKQYLGTEDAGWGAQVESGIVTRFKELNAEVTPLLKNGEYRGDKGLYEWLRQNELLYKSDAVRRPRQDKDANYEKISYLQKQINCIKKQIEINDKMIKSNQKILKIFLVVFGFAALLIFNKIQLISNELRSFPKS